MVATCFPDILPDECILSAVARYKHRLMFFSSSKIFEICTFKAKGHFRHDLPTFLGSLAQSLPNQDLYTIDYLIDKCTLFPYYRPFLPQERQERLRQSMRANDASAILDSAGIRQRKVPVVGWLRYCPECFMSDCQRYGEPYWHRLHQIRGVEVCPEHRVFLQNSTAPLRLATTKTRLLAAEELCHEWPRIGQRIDDSDMDHQVLLRLAQDAQWLLAQTELKDGPEAIVARFRMLFIDRGMATKLHHKIQNQKILADLSHYYSPALLRLLNCELPEKAQQNWLSVVLRGSWHASDPIRFLLLIQYLEHSAESFFRLPDKYHPKPFGDGPWPCLNPVCSNHQESVIHSVTLSKGNNPPRLRGDFACHCGFVYRYSRDVSQE
jgi:hypothetical protein